MKSFFGIGLVAVFGLAGCGGGSTGSGAFTGEAVRLVENGVAFRYDEASDTYVVSKDGDSLVLERNPGNDREGFEAYRRDTYMIVHVGETSSEASYAFVAHGKPFYLIPGGYESDIRLNHVEFGRAVPTSVPVSGTATYEGNYVGILYNESDLDIQPIGGFEGDVTLNADFDKAEIYGTITDRVYLFPYNQVAKGNIVRNHDVHFSVGQIDSTGAFSGSVVGGGYDTVSGVGDSVASGTFSGIVSGDSGQEIVGGLLLNHVYKNDPSFVLQERGVFVAEQQ